MAQIAASIVEFGFTNPILVDSMDGIIAGHGRLLAARKLGLAEVPVVVLDHLSETQRRAYIIADNKLAMNAGWDEKILASELRELEKDGMDLAVVGFSDEELEALLEDGDAAAAGCGRGGPRTSGPAGNPARRRVVDRSPPPDLRRLPRRGDGSQRFSATRGPTWSITSPPYATQREYDPSSGFKPVPPDEYVEWFRAVAAGVESVLAPDGSYFLNIKEHADDGERESVRDGPGDRAPAAVGLAVRG